MTSNGVRSATKAYESWLSTQLPLVPADLRLKHERMTDSSFAFLRATFYRWAQLWSEVCPELASAPQVLGVGDLHVENFGTWRDSEGRLIWGINDFDEACRLPYAADLVRLAVSAQLAARENQLSCDLDSICAAIRAGYADSMEAGGRPFVLAEHHGWLRDLALSELRDPVQFWKKLTEWPDVSSSVPGNVRRALKHAFPLPGLRFKVIHRQAGLGSLGRRRYTALARCGGGLIAREAKELTLSASHWSSAQKGRGVLRYMQVMGQAVRVIDPFIHLNGKWLIRRLAPDCSRIELASLPKAKDELKLLHAMGWETANVHLGTKRAIKSVLQDLRKRPANWLTKAASAMTKVILAEWREWSKKS